MADSMQNLLTKHVEKIILAAAIVIFGVALTVFVVMRDSVFGDQNLVRTRVESLVKKLVDSRKAPGLDKALSPEERVALGIEQTPLMGEQFIKDRDALPPPWDASTDKWAEPKAKGTTIIVKEPVAPAIVTVTDLQVFQGRGTTAETVPAAVFKLEKPTPLADIVWAGVVGHMDLTEQLAAYNAAHVDPLDPNGIMISKVELQRREEKPDGTWSEWKSVMPALSAAAAAKWPKPPANPRDKAAVGAWYMALKTGQADVRRMPLYSLVAQDKQGQTADAVAGAITGVQQPEMKKPPEVVPAVAPTAPAGETPPPAPAPAAPEAAPAAALPPWLQPAAPAKVEPTPGAPAAPAAPKRVIATLWAYDTTVEPGKTYQYQMRTSVFNPIYSNPEVKDDKARWALEFPGAWSEASREVSIPNLVEFFFIGTAGTDKVNLELHRWILGQWVIQPSVQCFLGGPITFSKRQKLTLPGGKGGTGTGKDAGADTINVDMNPQVLLVDVLRRFPYVPGENTKPTLTNILIYANARGQLERRTEWDDKNAARSAKAEREPTGTKPPIAPKEPTPPPTPRPPKEPPKPRPPRTTK